MQGMKRAVARLWEAIDKQEHICIYGDYDVDGTTSVVLCYEALKKLGAKHLTYYIPSRQKEGYGLSQKAVDHLLTQDIDLLLAVDCGTRAVGPIQHALDSGIETIVCDHHEVGEKTPQVVAMLNPKQPSDTYPFKGLSACGVAFKLIQAMATWGKVPLDTTPYLDLVALSIAADIVPMVGENRILMHHGLHRLNDTPRPGIAALKQLRQQTMPFTVSDVVFGIAPLINAAGRMSHASAAVELLLSPTQEEAAKRVTLLAGQNVARKDLDAQVTQEALGMVEGACEAIVLHKDSWPKGILGIVAARCVEHHYRPTIILTQEGEQLTGSGRSVAGFNLYEAVDACKGLLTRYGGHAQAVGLTLPLKEFEAFSKKFTQEVTARILPDHKVPAQKIDLQISLEELTYDRMKLLERIAPFGPAHRHPIFATSPVEVVDHKIYQGKHVKIFFKEKGSELVWDAIGFNLAGQFLSLYPECKELAIAYKASRNQFQGIERIELVLKDIKGSIAAA